MAQVLLSPLILGAYDTFPAKSINLDSTEAITFFKKFNAEGDLNVLDAHAVHGIQVSHTPSCILNTTA